MYYSSEVAERIKSYAKIKGISISKLLENVGAVQPAEYPVIVGAEMDEPTVGKYIKISRSNCIDLPIKLFARILQKMILADTTPINVS